MNARRVPGRHAARVQDRHARHRSRRSRRSRAATSRSARTSSSTTTSCPASATSSTSERRRILEGEDLHEQVQHFLDRRRSSAYIDGATAEGRPEDWDLDAAVDRPQGRLPGHDHAATRSSSEAGGPSRLTADFLERRDPLRRRAAYAGARGADRLGEHAPARAARDPVGPRPQVARAPLRDGLPQGGHRPARDGPARPAGGVPARGLPALPRDDRGHQGGDRRLPVQPRGPGRGSPTPPR